MNYYDEKQRRTLEVMRLMPKAFAILALIALLLAIFSCSTARPATTDRPAGPCADTLVDRSTGDLILIGCE